MNFYLKAILFLIATIFYSCKCGETTCPGLEAEYTAWLPYKASEVITYQNNTGQQIQFVVDRYREAKTQNLDCGPNGGGGCICPDCPEPVSSVYALSNDTTRQKGKLTYNNLSANVGRTHSSNDSVYLTYSVFDHNNSIVIAPGLRLGAKDSLLSSYTVGNHTYSNVIVHETDTTFMGNPNPIYNVYFAWKSYYNKQYGVIAFHDLKTRTFFYRKL